jgi:hypothetical protein
VGSVLRKAPRPDAVDEHTTESISSPTHKDSTAGGH